MEMAGGVGFLLSWESGEERNAQTLNSHRKWLPTAQLTNVRQLYVKLPAGGLRSMNAMSVELKHRAQMSAFAPRSLHCVA